MTKLVNRSPRPADPAPRRKRPEAGGSWLRGADGRLTRIDEDAPVAEADAYQPANEEDQ